MRIVSDRFQIAKVSDFDPDGDRTGKSITWAFSVGKSAGNVYAEKYIFFVSRPIGNAQD